MDVERTFSIVQLLKVHILVSLSLFEGFEWWKERMEGLIAT